MLKKYRLIKNRWYLSALMGCLALVLSACASGGNSPETADENFAPLHYFISIITLVPTSIDPDSTYGEQRVAAFTLSSFEACESVLTAHSTHLSALDDQWTQHKIRDTFAACASSSAVFEGTSETLQVYGISFKADIFYVARFENIEACERQEKDYKKEDEDMQFLCVYTTDKFTGNVFP